MVLNEDLLEQNAHSLSPLPDVLSQGLIAVATCGFLSFFLSVTLFAYLTYRFIKWRWDTGTMPSNQFLLLIYNLLLADIQQAIAFMLNVSALHNDAIRVGTTTCWAQGWFVSTGDLASSLFILAIAIHTFMAVNKGYKLSTPAFWLYIAAFWIFNFALGIIGAVMHPEDLYVRAGAWCWINSAYQMERLWLHYFWIFLCMGCTISIYAIILIRLHVTSRANASAVPHGATPLMVLYPAIYTICTIPLAAARIANMAGRTVPLEYFCVAGAMIASNGFLDVLLYAWTRREIVFADDAPGIQDIGLETFRFLGKGNRDNLGTTTVIEANHHNRSEATDDGNPRLRAWMGIRRPRADSEESLYFRRSGGSIFTGIQTETTVVVTSEIAESHELHSVTTANLSRTHSKSSGRSNFSDGVKSSL